MSDPVELGEIIAEREVTFTAASGDTEEVHVRIGKPILAEAPGLWRCPYQIEGLGRVKTFSMAGVDAVQALLLTLQVILPELEHIAKREKGAFSWLEDKQSGFPDYRLSPDFKGPK